MPDRLNLNTTEIDLHYIKNIVQEILNKSFSNVKKREIIVRPNESYVKELNFSCPICGDSVSRDSLKRGHLFVKNLFFKCYNDESCSMSFTKFCKRFNVEIDIEKKMQMYTYLDNNWKYEKKEDFVLTNMDRLLDLDKFFEEINKNRTFLRDTSPIVDGSVQHRYLTDRKIFNHENIRQGNYKITDSWTEPVIIILNRSADKLLGMQLRNLRKEKDRRIYKFMNFQEIYNLVNPTDPLDELESINYNKASSIFNILNIEFEDTIHVFEGYLDSLFFPNSIALVGLETDISFLSNDNLDLRFVLDNDRDGKKKSKEMIEKGYSVFLWNRLYKDLSKGKGSKFKYILDTEVKDINKLVEVYGDSHIYENLNLKEYFAKDKFDLIDM